MSEPTPEMVALIESLDDGGFFPAFEDDEYRGAAARIDAYVTERTAELCDAITRHMDCAPTLYTSAERVQKMHEFGAAD